VISVFLKCGRVQAGAADEDGLLINQNHFGEAPGEDGVAQMQNVREPKPLVTLGWNEGARQRMSDSVGWTQGVPEEERRNYTPCNMVGSSSTHISMRIPSRAARKASRKTVRLSWGMMAMAPAVEEVCRVREGEAPSRDSSERQEEMKIKKKEHAHCVSVV